MRLLRSTRGVFACLLAGYGVLCLPAVFWPGYLDSPVGRFAGVPYVSIYAFDAVGIPWLLQHGACDWGWCPPTTFGWAFLVAAWLGPAWLIAAGVARLARRFGQAGA